MSQIVHLSSSQPPPESRLCVITCLDHGSHLQLGFQAATIASRCSPHRYRHLSEVTSVLC
jgi:hypothetical protein